jgi:tetratricopeptide (TPR) repeat protein
MSKRAIIALLAVASIAAAFADSFSDGEDAFMRNQPKEAIPLLEKAIKENPKEEKAYLYLGIAYIQVGRLDDALAAFNRGLTYSVAYRAQFYYNMGNVLALQDKNAFAEEMYNMAIVEDPSYPPAYLNRANVRVKTAKYPEAVEDYRTYLAKNPTSPQKSNIEALIALLEKQMADQAVADAEAKARAEAEAAAQAALLQQVTDSLTEAATDTTNISAGTGDVQDYTDSLDIE